MVIKININLTLVALLLSASYVSSFDVESLIKDQCRICSFFDSEEYEFYKLDMEE
jgi:hypothetical protein